MSHVVWPCLAEARVWLMEADDIYTLTGSIRKVHVVLYKIETTSIHLQSQCIDVDELEGEIDLYLCRIVFITKDV